MQDKFEESKEQPSQYSWPAAAMHASEFFECAQVRVQPLFDPWFLVRGTFVVLHSLPEYLEQLNILVRSEAGATGWHVGVSGS